MMRLLDGPAVGSYAVKHAPEFLRAVMTAAGAMDVLDRYDDKPIEDEAVYVYRRVADRGTVHLNRGRGSGFYVMADYRHMPDVDGEALRDNGAWQAWVRANGGSETQDA